MSVYTSTGKKILRHLDYLKSFQETHRIKPISLQIAPTSRCNLNCCFCSNANRQQHEDLLLVDLFSFLAEMRNRGAKTVEWTGGGDPTQYEYIRNAIAFAHNLEFQQGFITNGIDLVKNVGIHIQYLDWVRISLNSLDYIGNIDIPIDYKGTLGFSYVMNEKTNSTILARVQEFVRKHKPKYVRIVPNCQISSEELRYTNVRLSRAVANWGPPYFYQAKSFSQPERCWWGYFKPFLLHDGFVYPCSSVVLNDTAEKSFHTKYRWMSAEEYTRASELEAIPFDCKDCTNCVFGEQNSLVESLMNPEMERFV